MSDIILHCEQISKHYHDSTRELAILNAIQLTVYQGEQLAIMGRSGSGKSTLLHILGGLDSPSSGEVTLAQQPFSTLSEKTLGQVRNRSLGFIYQSHHLLPEFSALENVAMPLLIGGVSISDTTARASALLEEVGLKDRLTHRPGELSGGERQRVAIARALINEPNCVLADEPTGNLDNDTAREIFALLQKLNRRKNTTLIMVTHDTELATQMDRTLYLHNAVLNDTAA